MGSFKKLTEGLCDALHFSGRISWSGCILEKVLQVSPDHAPRMAVADVVNLPRIEGPCEKTPPSSSWIVQQRVEISILRLFLTICIFMTYPARGQSTEEWRSSFQPSMSSSVMVE